MSLEEKVLRTYGSGSPPEGDWSIAGSVAGIERLDIPPVHMADGPTGASVGQPTTDFPHPVAAASTFDPSLTSEQGAAMARELKAAQVSVLLAPSMDLFRIPFHSRAGETYGEDPLLAGEMVTPYVEAVQDGGVIATAKHFTGYNQTRTTGDVADSFSIAEQNVIVDERTLRELYLPAFRKAVQEGGAEAVMTAYNRINGTYSSQHQTLLREILKDEWSFEGFVVSDWGGTHSTVDAANSGLDIEMPRANYFGDALATAIKNDNLDEAVLNDMVRRGLHAQDAIGALSRDRDGVGDTSVIGADEHVQTARTIAQNASVLLKNEDLLPFADSVSSVAVVGPDPSQFKQSGGGSDSVQSTGDVAPAEGINAATDGSVSVETAATDDLELVSADDEFEYSYYDNADLEGEPIETGTTGAIDLASFPEEAGGVVLEGTVTPEESGTYGLEFTSRGQGHVYVDDELVGYNEEFAFAFFPPSPERSSVDLEAGTSYDVRVEVGGGSPARLRWNPPSSRAAAVEAAKNNDAVVFLARTYTNYGDDRYKFGLPGDQESAISSVVAANDDTAVVLNTEAPVGMPWVDDVPAILQAWYPGQEGGRAVANLLFGDVNPSGKTPVTFAQDYQDYLPQEINTLPEEGRGYPGISGNVYYDEGVFVGYRHFDEADIEPLFEFGHGESYTSFEYGDMTLCKRAIPAGETVSVDIEVTNTGDMDGDETVQVYVSEVDPVVERPPKELGGFDKVSVPAGETRTATIELDAEAFQYWDPEDETWTIDPGKFQVLIGASSRDIRAEEMLIVHPNPSNAGGRKPGDSPSHRGGR
ncbi:beta-glucosidase H [Haloarcula amylovorans]|uniref:beta-glucosidase H n=1 Tax=Haloarcula amylovorans TaxID=2562280 RepID=UPI00143160D0|nr:glycoside hydrolase family 3 C-terminal domain-containing protein [Halomicroarcula amylolytica]